MNEDQPTQEKDFRILISQFNNYSESRDKIICEIDDILDRIKPNRRPNAEVKQGASTLKEPDYVISQFRELSKRMDLANEKLTQIICRLNELI